MTGLLILQENSARVFEGTWNGTQVAVKILKMDDGVAPNSEVRLDVGIQFFIINMNHCSP